MTFDPIQSLDPIERQKTALNEARAALAAAQATQATGQSVTGPVLIPKPRGTSGRGDFNLANAMGVDAKVCREIQASVSPCPHAPFLTEFTGICPLAREHVSPRQGRVMEEPTWG